MYLNSSEHATQIVGSVSTWIDTDSDKASVRHASVSALQHELSWAAHLGLQAVMLPTPPRPARVANYAQALLKTLQGLTHMALWVVVPLAADPASPSTTTKGSTSTAVAPPPSSSSSSPKKAQPAAGTGAAATTDSSADAVGAAGSSPDDYWRSWHTLRTLCEAHNLMGVVLLIPADLPPQPLIDRWLGEPVRSLLLPTSLFTTNKKGYPVLSRAHQELVSTWAQLGVQVVLCGEADPRLAAASTSLPGAAAAAPPPGGVSITPAATPDGAAQP